MPISSPRRPRHDLSSILTRALAAFFLTAALASAQTLARPGVNGINADPWWQHAVFYEADPATQPEASFKAIALRLNALRDLSVDALLLPAPTLPADDPTLNDLDDLIRQASNHGMRVLLTLPANVPNPTAAARFWLNRGVAGLRVVTPPGADPTSTQTTVQTLRTIAGATVGQRIILSDFDPNPAATPAPFSRRASTRHADRKAEASGAQLQIDSRIGHLASFDAASLRPLLTQTLAQPNLLLDLHSPSSAPSLADVVAAVAITLHPITLIDADLKLVIQPATDQNVVPPPLPPPPPPPHALPPGTYVPYVPYVPPPRRPAAVPAPKPIPTDRLTTWYGQLAALRHSNPVLRLGTTTLLDFDQQNTLVWVTRVANSTPLTPPVFVLCNLSAQPVTLSLAAAAKNLNLHGFFLRTLLRSDNGMGAQDINAVAIPPFGVYIGELRR